MIGITLSPEEIEGAPPEVRRWLERKITVLLGQTTHVLPHSPQLANCTLQEAEAIYVSLRDVVPVVNVFFELGRGAASVVQDDMEAFTLADLLHHTRLPDLQQLIACLRLIDRAFHETHGENDALFAVDQEGYCIMLAETRRTIRLLWNHLIAAHAIVPQEEATAADAGFALPFTMSGTVPSSSIHLSNVFSSSGAPEQSATNNGARKQ
ncbi:hypothetical protein [Mesorhizobium retamae]|uniref:Uncharacterized protein n=1 Tax=Mesorhizobium retamae TaxID=2912854 RepID=A0ABS9QF23_9HYPH|nr:hypothetical protein [Mesorhizobium sp. IRAMC:0171]MCG7506034.1 hypothetical protein [Mesorhizobium sp. IRAMC:0171]